METIIIALITAFVSSLGTSGILAWWFKKRIEHRYEKDIVTFKHNLELAASERSVRYSEIFVRTADTIVKTYQLLLPVLDAAEDYTRLLGSNDTKENINALQEKVESFYNYFHPNKIYIPRDTSTKIIRLMNTLNTVVRRHSMLNMMTSQKTIQQESIQARIKELQEIEQTIPSLLKALENDFQSKLGLPIQTKPATADE